MTKGAKIYLLVVLLSMICGLILINWCLIDNPSNFSFLVHKIENTSNDIESIDVEFSGRKVFLNVRPKRLMSCNKVIADLGINNIIVSSKVYVPTCTSIDRNLIRITYSEILAS